MIPKQMEKYLKEYIPEAAMKNRTRRKNGRCFLEFGYSDEQLLSRLGINRDKLGPRLVACRWDEALSLEVGGYLVVDRLRWEAPPWAALGCCTILRRRARQSGARYDPQKWYRQCRFKAC